MVDVAGEELDVFLQKLVAFVAVQMLDVAIVLCVVG